MRILIDSGCYDLCNMGDVAMLQVAAERLSNLWPHASIEIITNKPMFLSNLCPKATAIGGNGRHIWFYDRNILGRLYNLIPRRIGQNLQNVEQWTRCCLPGFYKGLIRFKSKIGQRNIAAVENFLEALLNTDLLVISGSGGINDHFANFAMTTLELLGIANKQGIPTVMFSQGIGPISNARLVKKAKTILPSVCLIAIREKVSSLKLLKSLGVQEEKILVTGDDAIEPAYNSRPARPGRCIGVNLRISSYSQATDEHIKMLGNIIQNSGLKYCCPIMPLPISFYENESDAEIIRRMTGAYFHKNNINSPQEIIEKVSDCRIVVTGSYHSAVFALSQGIPAITMFKTAYYKNKFLGLANQFGCGCEVMSLDDRDFAPKLAEKIDTAWQSAEALRPKLLQAAENQIKSSQKAYEKIYDILEGKKRVKLNYTLKNKVQYA